MSTKQFRSNTFSIFMIVRSIINTFILVSYVGLIIVSAFIGFSPRTTFTSWCKVYTYIYYLSVYTSITLLAVATIDRWLSTSRKIHLRSFSSIRNTRIIIGGVLIFFSLLLIPHPIYSEVFFDPQRNTTTCDRPDGIYKLYVNYCLVILVHAISILIMIVFGFLTYRHLTIASHGQIHGGRTMKHRLNIQMTGTIFLQIILFIISIIPSWVISIIYPAVTANIIYRSAERISIELLANNLGTLLYFESFADTFYILFIISTAFRRNVKQLLIYQHGHNQVMPIRPT